MQQPIHNWVGVRLLALVTTVLLLSPCRSQEPILDDRAGAIALRKTGTSMDSATRKAPVCIIGARLHVLIDRATYDIAGRVARAPAQVLAQSLAEGSAV